MSITQPIGEFGYTCAYCGSWVWGPHACHAPVPTTTTSTTWTFKNKFKMKVRKQNGKWKFNCECLPELEVISPNYQDMEHVVKKHFHKYISDAPTWEDTIITNG